MPKSYQTPILILLLLASFIAASTAGFASTQSASVDMGAVDVPNLLTRVDYDDGATANVFTNVPAIGSIPLTYSIIGGGQAGTDDSVVTSLNAGYSAPVVAPPVGK